MDLSDLAVESIEVVPAGSLDSAAYGHGMPELAASCIGDCSDYCKPNGSEQCLKPVDEKDQRRGRTLPIILIRSSSKGRRANAGREGTTHVHGSPRAGGGR